uniref:Syntaxin N-terminal domain-containing protein n=1 Tax=Acrobeloides nanus TaxID=290746 RepID=A0A914EII3_9BILA
MEECLNSIRDIHDAILKSPSVNPNLSNDLNSKLESFKAQSYAINNVLKAMNSNISPDFEANQTNFRIKQSQMMNISRKFQNLMIEFNHEQLRYREKSQQRIRSYL